MIKLKRYSYSGLNLWKVNPAKFYCKYLSETPLEREPTTIPLRVGLAVDALMKADMEKDLGIANSNPLVSDEDRDLVKDVYQWFKDSGVYGRLVGYFREILDNGGEVVFEGEIKRSFEHKSGVNLNILGYADFMYRTSKTEPWSILDLKTTGFLQTKPSSPRSPYNEAIYKDGKVKRYAKFEPCADEEDSFCGIGLDSIPKMHKGQITTYSYVLNHNVEGIEWDGEHRVGIIQLQPTYVGLSYGKTSDNSVIRDFERLHECVIAGKPFGLDWSDAKTKEEMDKWDDLRIRSCMLPTNFF